MLDYDLHHDALNHAYLSSNLQLTRRLRIYGTIDHRRNPYLTTRNALIGQPLQDLSELELQLVEDDLEDIAADRTAVSTLVRVGLDQQLGGWTLSTDVSMTDFKATEESLNVAALDAHQDLYLSTQLRADNAFGNGNYGALQVRYYESDDSRTMGMMLNSRFGLLESWWLYPRVAVDQRTQTNSDLKQLRIRPSLRLDYRHARWLRLEMEVGYEWTEREMFSQDLDMQGLFLRAGYRALF